jgi:hypothetical protein
MVRGIEQLYQDTADAVSMVLERRLPGGFAQVWIRVEMPGESSRVTCYYTSAAEPEKTFPMASYAGLIDLYLIFDGLLTQLAQCGDHGSVISLLINSDGEYFFELGTGSRQYSQDQASTHQESAAQENSIIETVHFSPDIISA